MFNKNTNILTLDLGTKTGWSFFKPEGIISGTQTFHLRRFDGGGIRYLQFQIWLNTIFETNGGIDVIYYEEIRRHLGVDAAHVYGGFISTLSVWCEIKEIPYQGVNCSTIKKFICGRGNASKKDVIEAIQKRGNFIKDDNEADALALMYFILDKNKIRNS